MLGAIDLGDRRETTPRERRRGNSLERVDCMMASGETCLVIELKPSGSRAVSKGRDQVRTDARELTTS
jgi:hypothetical protein